MDNDYVFRLGLGWRVGVKSLARKKQVYLLIMMMMMKIMKLVITNATLYIYIYIYAFSVAKCSVMSSNCTFCMFYVCTTSYNVRFVHKTG